MKMKRLWLALVGVFALCFTLVACGKAGANAKADFVGTWEITGMTEAGEETDAETLEAMKGFGLNVYLELKEDGTASIDLFGATMDGTWKATGAGKGTITFEDSEAPMVLNDGALTMESDDSKLVFGKIDPSERQSAAVDDSAVAVEDETDAAEDEGSDEESGGGEVVTENQDPTTSAETTADEGEEGLTSWGGDAIDDLDNASPLEIYAVDDEMFTIKILAKGTYIGDPAFYFEITNKTDADAGIDALDGSWTVNGASYDPIVLETIPAGETLGTIGWFSADEVGSDVYALGTITGQVEMVNENHETIATYNVTID